MGVDAGADGGAAEGEFAEGVLSAEGAFDGLSCLRGVTGDFLAETDGGGVCEVRAADFHDRVEIFGFFLERELKVTQGRDEGFFDRDGGGDVDGGGDDVVGALLHVDVIVGVDWIFAPAFPRRDFIGAAGEDLVGVHVGRRAGAGLEDVDDELGVELPVDYFRRGLLDEGFLRVVDELETGVDLGAGPFDESHRGDEAARETQIGDGEVLGGAGGLGAVVGVLGDLHFSHGVAFGAG